MTSRNTLFTALALGLVLSAPAFAQDQTATPAAQEPVAQDQSAASTAQDQIAQDPTAQDQATTPAPTDPAAQSTDPAAQPNDSAAAPQGPTATQQPTAPTSPHPSTAPGATGEEPQKVTWSDLDTDKDGKLSKPEVASVQALTQVFDAADTDKDGALTPDEYKAYIANGNQGASAPTEQPDE